MSKKILKNLDFSQAITLSESENDIENFFNQFCRYCLEKTTIKLIIDQKDVNNTTLNTYLTDILTYGTYLSKLFLFRCFLSNQSIEEIASCKELSNLKSLALINTLVNDDDVKAIFSSNVLINLELLNISDNNITDEGAKTISSSSKLQGLITLVILNNRITKNGLAELSFTSLLKLKNIYYAAQPDNLKFCVIKPSIFKPSENLDNILLPNEMWFCIIQNLSSNDIQSLKHVNRHFYHLLKNSSKDEVELKLTNNNVLSMFKINPFSRDISDVQLILTETNNKTILVNIYYMHLANFDYTNVKYLKIMVSNRCKFNIKTIKDFNTINSNIFKNLIFLNLKDMRFPKPRAIGILKKILKENSNIVIKFSTKFEDKDGKFKIQLKELATKYSNAAFIYENEIFSHDGKMPKWLINY